MTAPHHSSAHAPKHGQSTDDDHAATYDAFKDLANMTPAQLEKWLATDESGRHIIDILGKKKADLTDGDYAHMRKVIGYIKRHLAQRPHEIEHSHWRYSLMNWGHDPLK